MTNVRLPRLRARRLQAGLTQEELAVRAGLQRLAIIKIEAGRPATLRTLGKLAAALECKTLELTGPLRNSEPPRSSPHT